MDAYQPDNDLAQNYADLAEQRGTTLPAIADEHEQHSPQLAAWMRSQDAGAKRDAAPKGRRAKAAETAEG